MGISDQSGRVNTTLLEEEALISNNKDERYASPNINALQDESEMPIEELISGSAVVL